MFCVGGYASRPIDCDLSLGVPRWLRPSLSHHHARSEQYKQPQQHYCVWLVAGTMKATALTTGLPIRAYCDKGCDILLVARLVFTVNRRFGRIGKPSCSSTAISLTFGGQLINDDFQRALERNLGLRAFIVGKDSRVASFPFLGFTSRGLTLCAIIWAGTAPIPLRRASGNQHRRSVGMPFSIGRDLASHA